MSKFSNDYSMGYMKKIAGPHLQGYKYNSTVNRSDFSYSRISRIS